MVGARAKDRRVGVGAAVVRDRDALRGRFSGVGDGPVVSDSIHQCRPGRRRCGGVVQISCAQGDLRFNSLRRPALQRAVVVGLREPRMTEHVRHGRNIGNRPRPQTLIEERVFVEHGDHVRDIEGIPRTQTLIE